MQTMSPIIVVLPFEYHKRVAVNSQVECKIPIDSGAGLSWFSGVVGI